MLFLFPAKRPLRKIELSSYSRRAGQRRFFQRIILALFYMGPAFTAFRQSLLTEKALPVRPKLRISLLPRIHFSRNKNIDIFAACHHDITTWYIHNFEWRARAVHSLQIRFELLPRTRCSCNKNIDVLAACHRENDGLYGHHLGRRWWCFSPWNDCPNAVRTGPQTAQTKHWAEHTRRRSCPAQVTKKSIHSLVGHSVQRRKVLPPPPKLSCNKNLSVRTDKLQFASFFYFFSKKVLTIPSDSCNIIQVADRHGNETAQQALIGRPLWKAEKLRKQD